MLDYQLLNTTFDENLVKYFSPLVREHINLTGNYI